MAGSNVEVVELAKQYANQKAELLRLVQASKVWKAMVDHLFHDPVRVLVRKQGTLRVYRGIGPGITLQDVGYWTGPLWDKAGRVARRQAGKLWLRISLTWWGEGSTADIDRGLVESYEEPWEVMLPEGLFLKFTKAKWQRFLQGRAREYLKENQRTREENQRAMEGLEELDRRLEAIAEGRA